MTLRIDDLSVRYPSGRPALDRVSLRVGDTETVAVVGRSGCGKSTLVRAVLGLLPHGSAVSGSIRLALGTELVGLDHQGLRRVRGVEIGYVGQDPFQTVDPWWRVGHHLAEPWRAHGLRVPWSDAVESVAALGVDHPAERLRQRPRAWSGGMLQRADIAAATAHRPAVLIADEPTSALDAPLARRALETLVSAARSVLLVSHDLGLVAEYADRVIVLEEGRLVEELVINKAGIDALDSAARQPATRQLIKALPRFPETFPSLPEPVEGPVAALETVRLGYPKSAPVVEGINLSIAAGELIGLCGPSGSGKSTILRALAGSLEPLSGTVRWSGGSGQPKPGYVMPIFQDATASLDPRWPIWRSVAEAIAAADGTSLRTSSVRDSAVEWLRRVGLDDVDPDTRPRHLSGGQRQRVAIARALGGRARLVIADEPTAALDSVQAAEIIRLLKGLTAQGCGLMVVSHDERRLRSFCHRVLRLHEGRLVQT